LLNSLITNRNRKGDENLPRKTALNAIHRELGGELTDFGGWEMPLWYSTGSVKEHLAVIEKSGLFDIGHMDLLRIKGKEAFNLLQLCLTRDISNLKIGTCGYSMILNGQGHVVDDTIVYNLNEGEYILIVNAGMGPVVRQHLEQHNTFQNVSIVDESGRFSKIDLQGPASPAIVKRLLEKGRGTIEGLRYFQFRGDYADPASEIAFAGNIPVLLSRTGYTGEVGFEIVMPYDKTLDVWNMILDAGRNDVTPCGLAARDSLRTGAVLPLSHQDIGSWPFVHTPWDFALPRDKEGRFTKSFIGSGIYNSPPSLYTYPFCGFDPRKVETHGASVLQEGTSIGTVSTCAIDMAIGRVEGKIYSVAGPDNPASFKARGLVCGFVRVDRPLELGGKVILKDSRRSIKVEIMSDIRPNRTARVKI
jgi:aminomethyltransferase